MKKKVLLACLALGLGVNILGFNSTVDAYFVEGHQYYDNNPNFVMVSQDALYYDYLDKTSFVIMENDGNRVTYALNYFVANFHKPGGPISQYGTVYISYLIGDPDLSNTYVKDSYDGKWQRLYWKSSVYFRMASFLESYSILAEKLGLEYKTVRIDKLKGVIYQ